MTFYYLDYDEHVIDSDAKKQEGYDGVHVSVENLHEEAEAEGGSHGEADHERADDGQQNLEKSL